LGDERRWRGLLFGMAIYLLAGYVLRAGLGLTFVGFAISTDEDWTAWTVIALGVLFIITLAVLRKSFSLSHLVTRSDRSFSLQAC